MTSFAAVKDFTDYATAVHQACTTPKRCVAIQQENISLTAQLAALEELYRDRDRDLTNEYNLRVEAEAAVEKLREDLADTKQAFSNLMILHAQRCKELEAAAFDLECTAGELASCRRALAQLTAERDAALVDYSTGNLTTYTPVGERLVLANPPY